VAGSQRSINCKKTDLNVELGPDWQCDPCKSQLKEHDADEVFDVEKIITRITVENKVYPPQEKAALFSLSLSLSLSLNINK